MKDKLGTFGVPPHLAKEVAKPLTRSFFGAHGLTITIVGNDPQSDSVIPKSTMMQLLAVALNNRKIESYQAALMLAVNMRQPTGLRQPHQQSTYSAFVNELIELHNDLNISFEAKRRAIYRHMFCRSYITYEDLLRNRFICTDKDTPYSDDNDGIIDILYSNEGQPSGDYEMPQYIAGQSQTEIQPYILQPNVKTKTYSAIPKAIFLPLLSGVIGNGLIDYRQVALMLAVNCHSLEMRRNGQRYLDHVMAVAGDPTLTEDQRIIALLHDVIENSNYTIADMASLRLPERILVGIAYMTKRPEDSYFEFIQRLADNSDARAVKRADIRNNYPDASSSRREKYDLALKYFDAIDGGDIKPGHPIRVWALQNNICTEEAFNRDQRESIEKQAKRLRKPHVGIDELNHDSFKPKYN